MINYYLCNSEVALFCILPFYFWFEGTTEIYITSGRSKFKYMAEQGQDEELDVNFFYSAKENYPITMKFDCTNFKLTINGS